MASTRFVVRGRVQGVGFRWFVSREATRLQLRGWARNLEDGSVEVLAVGEAEAVERLAALLGRGPVGARVDRVEKMELPHEIKISKTFDIS